MQKTFRVLVVADPGDLGESLEFAIASELDSHLPDHPHVELERVDIPTGRFRVGEKQVDADAIVLVIPEGEVRANSTAAQIVVLTYCEHGIPLVVICDSALVDKLRPLNLRAEYRTRPVSLRGISDIVGGKLQLI